MSQEVSFNVTREEAEIIKRIAKRAKSRCRMLDSLLTIEMDVTATHANGCPLKLTELEAAPDFDFAHDLCGIRHHLNRETGELMDYFLPRYADLSMADMAAGDE